MTSETKTHDYRQRSWGHDYTFTPIDGGKRASAIGWGRGISAGDYLLLDNGSDNGTRYQVESISYWNDPSDMWKAALVFAPRQAVCPECKIAQKWQQHYDAMRMVLVTKWECGHQAEAHP